MLTTSDSSYRTSNQLSYLTSRYGTLSPRSGRVEVQRADLWEILAHDQMCYVARLARFNIEHHTARSIHGNAYCESCFRRAIFTREVV
jgi:hypothetical protein